MPDRARGLTAESTLQLRVTRNIFAALQGESETSVSGDRQDAGATERREQAIPCVSSAELLRGGREIVIEHGAERYRLRLTSRLGLILTK